MEKRELYSHQKLDFMKSIPCASFVVITLISRNFRQKSVRVNFRHLHTVEGAKKDGFSSARKICLSHDINF